MPCAHFLTCLESWHISHSNRVQDLVKGGFIKFPHCKTVHIFVRGFLLYGLLILRVLEGS